MGLRGRYGRKIRMLGSALAALSMAAGVPGCAREQVADIIPLFGCGLGSGDGRELRILARGDFQAVAATDDELRELPGGVQGITVEQVIVQTVEAVGRTARLQPEGDIPVYFSPPDAWCPAEETIEGREIGAMALDEQGRVLVIGGRSEGVLTDAIVSFRDVQGEAIEYETGLPVPALGQRLHAVGPDRFLSIGGISDTGVVGSSHVIEVGDSPEDIDVREVPIDADLVGGRALHASAQLPDGRIAVIGGCSAPTLMGCDAVLSSGFVVSTRGDEFDFESIPGLQYPRYDHDLLVSRDSVLFAVGGIRPEGFPENRIEVFLPQSGEWLSYGRLLPEEETAGQQIVGASLLEGGMIVVVLSDGQIWWVDEESTGRLPGWCLPPDPEDPEMTELPCFEEPGAGIPLRRHLTTLPGERVLIDNFVVGVAQLLRTGDDVLNLAENIGIGSGLGARIGAQSLVLDDGSVLVAGGVNPTSGVSVADLFLRFRPSLDGPDEAVPDVATLAPGSFIVHDPRDELGMPRVAVEGASLVMQPDPGLSIDRITTWAVVRSFRSQRFRFEATLEAQQGDVRPRLILTQGAVSRAIVRLDPDGVRLTVREPTGTGGLALDCSDQPQVFSGLATRVVAVVRSDRIDLTIGDGETVTCPGLGGGPYGIGLGAVGTGRIRASDLRLSRL